MPGLPRCESGSNGQSDYFRSFVLLAVPSRSSTLVRMARASSLAVGFLAEKTTRLRVT